MSYGSDFTLYDFQHFALGPFGGGGNGVRLGDERVGRGPVFQSGGVDLDVETRPQHRAAGRKRTDARIGDRIGIALGGRQQTEKDIINRTSQIIEEGASIIDIGAYSSRPNAEHISPEEEMRRLRTGLEIINRYHPGCVVSVDTFRADVARMCVEEYGVAIINDIAAGEMDPQMFDMVARLGVPYIIMHMQGTPQNMQMNPHYDNLLKEVFLYFSEKVQKLRDLGVKDIILDPGFGFGKTVEHNYQLMNHLEEFSLFELPLLVGISRKSMIYKLLGGTPDDALNGTTVLDTISLLKGADILRVHDVKAAVETVKIVQKMKDSAAF